MVTRITGYISRTLLHFRRTELDYILDYITKIKKSWIMGAILATLYPC